MADVQNNWRTLAVNSLYSGQNFQKILISTILNICTAITVEFHKKSIYVFDFMFCSTDFKKLVKKSE